MLERVCCIKPNPPQWEGPESTPFMSPIRRKMVRGASAHLKNFVVACFLVPGIRVGDKVVQQEKLNAMSIIGPQGSRGQVAALNCQRQSNHSYHNGQHRKINVHSDLTIMMSICKVNFKVVQLIWTFGTD